MLKLGTNFEEIMQVLKKNSVNKALVAITFLFLLSYSLFPQSYPASPANWMYPDGNSEGTKYLGRKSNQQSIDSFKLKWSTPSISGDVKPLIGNIINNDKLFSGLIWAPNEITAVVGGKIVVVDASGKTHTLGSHLPFVKGVSVLIDTLSTQIGVATTNPLILGIETTEFENTKDSLGFAYLAGFDQNSDTVAILNRLAIDLRIYEPNIFSSIKPVQGLLNGGNKIIYAIVNMSNPSATDPYPIEAPYFRGITQFNTGTVLHQYPMPDFGDIPSERVTIGPEVNISQPSMSLVGGVKNALLLPTYPSPSIDATFSCIPLTWQTSANMPYLIGIDISGSTIAGDIGPTNLDPIIPIDNSRPLIKPYYIHLTDANLNSTDSVFILLAEEYSGIDGSNGKSRLHLYDSQGDPITLPPELPYSDPNKPPIQGSNNHFWSIAVGNVDGNPENAWIPYYPNNPGLEIIATQSSRDFAMASSHLMILRYNSSSEYIEKPSPPNSYLFPFDTIATQRINGWVAAVNDIDGNTDNKDEIMIVDGSKLRVLRLKDYSSYDFRLGKPFDTLFSVEFLNQTISNVAVSDLEGDGLNDIIVTTYDSTYIIGSILSGTLNVYEPSIQFDPPTQYCAGDTLLIKWVNYIKSYSPVSIRFREIIDSIPVDTTILIEDNISNISDTVIYTYIVDDKILGKEGYFIVEQAFNPYKVVDSTSILIFGLSKLEFDSLLTKQWYAGDYLTITGKAYCVDSIAVEYSYDSTNWVRLTIEPVESDNDFSITTNLPCPSFYNCEPPDTDSLLLMHFVSMNSIYSDTSDIYPIKLLPALFPVYWDTCITCPSLEFKWDITQLKFECDTVSFLISINDGIDYSEMARVSSSEQRFLWNIPLGLPDSIKVRFCCENSCIRLDTSLNNFNPKYIQVVAPNPFNPPSEVMEIIYTVPVETDVTIRIFDQSNRLVSEIVRNEPRLPNIVYCNTWNGFRWDGATADNGMYYISLELSKGTKEVYPVFIRK